MAREMYPEGTVPRTVEDWSSMYNQPLIKGDGVRAEGFLPDVARGLDKGGEYLMDKASIWNPLTYPQWLVGGVLDGLLTPVRDYVNGDDVLLGDAGMAAMETSGAGQIAKHAVLKPVRNATAAGQNITQRTTAAEVRAAKEAGEEVDKSKDWYSGVQSKIARAFSMPSRAIKNFGRRLISPQADALYRRHGISPAQRDEFIANFKHYTDTPGDGMNNNEIISAAQYLRVMADKYFPNKPFLHDELAELLVPRSATVNGTDLAISGIPLRQMLDTDLPVDVVKNHLSIPTATRLGLDGKPVSLNLKVYNEGTGVPNTVSKNAIFTPNVTTKPGAGTKPMVQKADGTYDPPNYKTGHASTTNDDFAPGQQQLHGSEGRYDPTATAAMLWRSMPDDMPFTMDNLRKSAEIYNRGVRNELDAIDKSVFSRIAQLRIKSKKNKDGSIRERKSTEWEFKDRALNDAALAKEDFLKNNPIVDIDHLMGSAKVSDGYISFNGRTLGQDRLFAHYDTTFLIKEGSLDNGHMFVSDNMKLGFGKNVDKLVDSPTEWVGVDLVGMTKADGKIAAAQSTDPSSAFAARGNKSQTEVAGEIKRVMEERFAVPATTKDKAKTIGKAAAVTAKGAGSLYTIAELIWGDDSP
jgi:hypothetical protein